MKELGFIMFECLPEEAVNDTFKSFYGKEFVSFKSRKCDGIYDLYIYGEKCDEFMDFYNDELDAELDMYKRLKHTFEEQYQQI